MNSLKKKFGARIRELRKALGLSQDKLADKIDWEKSNLSNLENGKCFLKSENIEKFADALNVNVSDLFVFEHLQSKDFLVSELKTFIDNADETDIRFLYKTIQNLKEYKK